ncbi:hypothetical protein NDU88_001218 [Pleurodeles waltl]|uniref:Uncharacterized protein n=1 Tax=Pleurodeles waltl TaxID=8319 RepID=A0AAV7VW99_PLEWA|nr:hypothetical protein NDU88_001218 [Pleurodeles waltl]
MGRAAVSAGQLRGSRTLGVAAEAGTAAIWFCADGLRTPRDWGPLEVETHERQEVLWAWGPSAVAGVASEPLSALSGERDPATENTGALEQPSAILRPAAGLPPCIADPCSGTKWLTTGSRGEE